MADPEPLRSSPRLSKTPSWIMLGFVIGCIVAVTVMREYDRRHAKALAGVKPVEAAPVKLPTSSPIARDDKPNLAGIEAVFEQYRQFAVWENDVTEVALLDPTTQTFSNFFEVLRAGENLYYRTIPHLSRPVIPYDPPASPVIQFTEPEEARKWRLKKAMEEMPVPRSQIREERTPKTSHALLGLFCRSRVSAWQGLRSCPSAWKYLVKHEPV